MCSDSIDHQRHIASGSEGCMERLLNILGYQEQGMQVKSHEMRHRLVMPLEAWQALGEQTQGFIEDYAAGFTQGWAEAVEWTQYDDDAWERDRD